MQMKGVSANTHLYYNAPDAAVYGQIDSYEIDSSTTLSSVEEQIRLSSDTRSVQSTTVSGIPALRVTTRRGTLVVLIKGKYLFYVSGHVANDANLKFN
jgi:hypothetical protein